MTVKKIKIETDTTTEEKIKNAARIVFHKKGFSGTRTRDIAEEAGINLALLNYYFRSKQKLFDIIMFESVQGFLRSLREVFNNEKTTLEEKIESIACRYIDTLLANPNIPLFILSELKMQQDEFLAKMDLKEIVMKSHLMKQFQQSVKEGKIMPVHPLHFIMNMMGMTVFPFVASPLIKGLGNLSQKEFDELMLQRKQLVPKWVKAILRAK